MNLFPTIARWTNFFEKYVLSFFFLSIAYGKARTLGALVERVQDGYVLEFGSVAFALVVQNVLVLLFGIFFGLSLLLNSKPLQNPARWRDIVVPLIATFILYAFAWLAPLAPEFATRSLLPPSMQRTAAVLAIVVSLAGYAIALWSVAYLRRSLSLVVAVRPLVLRGPYRYVRHPMYLGYIVLVLGSMIAGASALGALLWIAYLLLTVYRARLEEEALSSFSQSYRDYAAQTGFLLPRLRRRGAPERSRAAGAGTLTQNIGSEPTSPASRSDIGMKGV